MGEMLFKILSDSRSVFTFNEIALLTGETNADKLKQRINYYVRNNKLLNLRRGIYAKEKFNVEEFVCKIYTPSYISLEYVLQQSGIIFQYSEQITLVSYLSRALNWENKTLQYRKIKDAVLISTQGINCLSSGVNMASAERAFLDTLYLYKDYYFDKLNMLSEKKVLELLSIYQSTELTKRVKKIL